MGGGVKYRFPTNELVGIELAFVMKTIMQVVRSWTGESNPGWGDRPKCQFLDLPIRETIRGNGGYVFRL